LPGAKEVAPATRKTLALESFTSLATTACAARHRVTQCGNRDKRCLNLLTGNANEELEK